MFANPPRAEQRDSLRFVAAVLAIAVLGAIARYWDVYRQVLLDDEWHALIRASHNSLENLITNYYPRATSIPNNAYSRLLLQTVGWTELGLRLPTIAASVLSLVLLPWLAWRATGSRALALTAAIAFAFSAFWLFYGQSARPYAPFLLLLLLAWYALLRALQELRMRAWLGFAVAGALAVYFHLYALPTLAPLCLVALVHQLWCARRQRETWRGYVQRVARIAFGFGLWTCLVAALFAKPLQNGMLHNFPRSVQTLDFSAEFFRSSIELLTGCRFTWLAWLLGVLALVGLVLLAIERPLAVSLLVAAGIGSLAFTFKQKPNGSDIALVVLRYNVVVYLVYYLGCGRAWLALTELARRALSRLPRASARIDAAMLALFAVGSFVASPLLRDFSISPNNFRLHAAFHESLSVWSRDRIRLLELPRPEQPASPVPDFYRGLAGEAHPCTVIEYPFRYNDDFDPDYFYQLVHRCEVVAGYSRADVAGLALNEAGVGADIRFRRLINVEREDRVRAKHARYLIVHVDEASEIAALQPAVRRMLPKQQTPRAELKRVRALLRSRYGEPVYSDALLEVFRL